MELTVENRLHLKTEYLYKTYISWTTYTAAECQHVFKASLLGIGFGLMTTGDTKAELHFDLFGLYFSFGIGYGW